MPQAALSTRTSEYPPFPEWICEADRPVYAMVAAAKGPDAAAVVIHHLIRNLRTAAIVRLWAEGRTAKQIANTLGDGISRNGVIGRLHRLGLKDDIRPAHARHRKNPSANNTRGHATSKKLKVFVATSDIAPRPPAFVVETPKPAPPRVVPRPEPAPKPAPQAGVAIHDLEYQHCRWPLNEVARGDGEHLLYCGDPRVDRVVLGMLCPYCAVHARMAYTPRTARTERRAAGDEKRQEAMLRRAAA